MTETNQEYKIVLLGDGGCGKTTFIKRFINGEFEKRYLATLGVEVTSIPFETTKGPVTLSVWDTAGQEKFGGLRDGYYTGAHLAIIFFDVTSKITFKNLGQWILDFRNKCPTAPIIIVGNKVDIKERKVKVQMGNALAHKYERCFYFDLSTKSCYNYDKPFLVGLKTLLNDWNLQFITQDTGPYLPPTIEEETI